MWWYISYKYFILLDARVGTWDWFCGFILKPTRVNTKHWLKKLVPVVCLKDKCVNKKFTMSPAKLDLFISKTNRIRYFQWSFIWTLSIKPDSIVATELHGKVFLHLNAIRKTNFCVSVHSENSAGLNSFFFISARDHKFRAYILNPSIAKCISIPRHSNTRTIDLIKLN